MGSNQNSKLNKSRTSIVNEDAQRLHQKFKGFQTPFHYLLKNCSYSFQDISHFFQFLSPPTDVENIHLKRKKPHYLLFIIDVLERFKLSCKLLLTRTTLQESGELHSKIIKYLPLAEDLITNLNKLSSEFSSLSTATFAKKLVNQAGGNHVPSEALKHQINIASEGFSTIFPIYGLFFDPYIHTKTEKDNIFIENYALMLGLVLNVIFSKPALLDEKINISINLRKTMELDLLQSSNIFTEIRNTSEVISKLNQEQGTTQIKKYLKYLYEEKKSRNSGSKQLTNHKRKASAHHQRFRYIRLPANMLFTYEEDDFQILQIRTLDQRHNVDEDEEPETWSDLSEDENISEEYFVYEPDKEAIHNNERLGLNNRFALAYIRRANQGFADSLSMTEWNQLKRSLTNKINALASSREKEISKISVLAIIQVGFLTGQSLREPFGIKILKDDLDTASSHLISVSHDASYLYLPLNIFYTEHYLGEGNQNYKTDSFLKIPVPTSIQLNLKKLIDKWPALHQYLDSSRNATNLPEPNMSCNKKLLKKTLTSIIQKSKVDERVTASFIERFIRYNYLRSANGDFWITSIFSGVNQSLGGTQKHYTTIINDYVYNTYKKAVISLFSETISLPKRPNPKKFIGIGNPARPLKHLTVSELTTMSDWLKPNLKADLSQKSHVELITILNTMTLFFETYTSFFNGARNVKNPYIHIQQIDAEGFTILADKVIAGGYNSRQVCVLPLFQSMQIDYEYFVKKIIDLLRKRKLLRIADLLNEKLNTITKWRSIFETPNSFYGFFLIDPSNKRKNLPRYKIVPYTRTAARKLYQESEINSDPRFFTLTTNANRHFLRSSLIERGVNPEYVDEYMGHRHFGTESWNDYALTNTQDFQKTVKTELKKILKDFGQISPFCRERE